MDSNHLVMDGSYSTFGLSKTSLNSQYVDIITNHYYGGNQPGGAWGDNGNGDIAKPKSWSYADRIAGDIAFAKGD
jgi:hypothetical protein